MRAFIVILLLLSASAYATPRTAIVLEGTITGHDGAPLARADVQVFRYADAKPFIAARANAGGAFRVRIKERGALRVVLSGVDHHPYEIPLVVARTPKITVHARLAAYEYRTTIDSVRIVGDFNAFAFSTAKQMQRRADGVFAIDLPVKADTFAYQVLGATRDGSSINGTMSDRAVPDAAGDYRSVVRATNGTVTILFDPTKLVVSHEAPHVVWAPRPMAHWVQTYAYLDSLRAATRAAAQKDPAAMHADAARVIATLASMIAVEKNALVKHLEYLAYIEYGITGVMSGVPTVDSTVVLRAIYEIPDSSPVWELNPGLVVLASAELGQRGEGMQYVDDVVARHYSTDVRAQVLYNMVQFAFVRGHGSASVPYYERLVNEYADTKWARSARDQYAPTRRIMAGKPLPEFSARSLDDSTVAITNASLKGSYVLFDFWAVWCKPCVAEMERLHAAHKTFGGRDLTIVSVSFDKTPADVAAFRAKTWPMPWLHVYAAGGFSSAFAETFEVHAIPKPVLVGPDGVILATDIDLRGERLQQTLEKYLR